MAWFADLAGRAESLLNNIDEQTGAAIRNHGVANGVAKKKGEKQDFSIQAVQSELNKRKPIIRPLRKKPDMPESKFIASNLSRRPPNMPRSIIKPQQDTGPKKPFLRKGSSQIGGPPLPAHLNSAQMYNLNNCPKTMVDDDDELLLKNYAKQRREYYSQIRVSYAFCSAMVGWIAGYNQGLFTAYGAV